MTPVTSARPARSSPPPVNSSGFRFREVLILIALSIVVAYTTVTAGGVSHTDQNFYLFGLALIAIVAAAWPFRGRQPRLSPVYRYVLPLLPVYAAFQILPMPKEWVIALSPARAQGINALESIGISSPYATLSVFPTATRNYVLLLSGYIVIFLLVKQLRAAFSKIPWILVIPLLLIASWEALLGIFQYALGPAGSVAKGNYVNRNHFAGLLELLLPFAAAGPLVFLRKNRAGEDISTVDALKVAALWTLAATFLVAIIFSQSRMGFLAALFSLLVVGILAVATKAHTLPSRRSVALLMAGVVTIVALAFIFLPTDELIRRYANAVVDVTEENGPETRLQDWRETIPLIRSYPIFGCGFGGYFAAFPKFKTVTPMLMADRAHNDYLQITAESGFIGATIFLILAVATVRTAVRRAFSATRPATWALSIGSLGALSAIALHSTVDFNLYIPANAMIVSWIAALSVGEGTA